MNRAPSVKLPNKLLGRCWQYGEMVVRGYARGLNANSLAVSSHAAEHNRALQARARMAECAFCLAVGANPYGALDWSNSCDDGKDVLLFGHLRIDVKHTRNGYFLIWPLNKRHIFDRKHFDLLVLVRGTEPIFEISGWVSKIRFQREHGIADETHKLDTGTWFFPARDLLPISELYEFDHPLIRESAAR